jgi:hypothetical protein
MKMQPPAHFVLVDSSILRMMGQHHTRDRSTSLIVQYSLVTLKVNYFIKYVF